MIDANWVGGSLPRERMRSMGVGLGDFVAAACGRCQVGRERWWLPSKRANEAGASSAGDFVAAF